MDAIFQESIVNFETAFNQLLGVAATYPENLQTVSGACGEWSLREVLIHLSGWIVEAQRRYPRYALGTGEMDYNVDAFNEISIWLRADKDVEQVTEELKRLVHQFASKARQIPVHQLERDARYQRWLDVLARDARDHADELRIFLETHQT